MKSRRSRFSRIYRQMTRRSTTRRQWAQISQLRPQGSPGYPKSVCQAYSLAPFAPAREESYETTDRLWLAESGGSAELSAEPVYDLVQRDNRKGMGAVMALAISLFALACAYSAFSGYMHAANNLLAWFGVVGAMGCLIAAATGISLALSVAHWRYSGRFLGLATIFMTSLFGLMLISAMNR